MGDGIYVALSGAVAQSTALEATATNLANAQTPGYQRVRPIFREMLARQGGALLRFAGVAATALDTTTGPQVATGRALDVALPAGTYLAVGTPRGERYTRAAAMEVASDGALKTTHGQPVTGEDGRPLRAATNADPVTVAATGEVRQGSTLIGRLRLVSFAQPENLAHDGGTLLAAPPGAGALAASKEPIVIGSIEESNASVVGAMTDLVAATRTFEAFQRAIDAFRDADRRVATTVPSTGG